MHLFLLLFSSLLLGFVCWYSVIRISADLRKSYVLLMTVRFGFFAIQSFLFYAIYSNQLDTFFYHNTLVDLLADFKNYPEDGVLFLKGDYQAMHLTPWLKHYLLHETRVAFFLKVLLPFFMLSANNYYILGAWLTLFGTCCFIPFLSLFKNKQAFGIWLLVLLMPSFTIWTVGVLKEAFVIPVLFLLFYLLKNIVDKKGKDVWSVFIFIAMLVLAWNVKYYLVALFLLLSIVYFMFEYVSISKRTIILSLFAFIAMLLGLGFLHPALHWSVFPEVIYISNHVTCVAYVDAYPCIPFELDKSWHSIFVNFPKAILYAFFSPAPWHIHNATSLVAAIENYVFIGMLVLTIYGWYAKKITISTIEFVAICVILVLGGLLIMASPNIGSFSRYRIFYLPVYGFILLKNVSLIYTTVFFRFKNWLEK
jgi:hypothetical protein